MVTTLNRWRHRPDYGIGASCGAVNGSSAQANRGILYHRRVFRALQQHTFGMQLLIEPWLQEHGTGRFLQPDAVLIDRGERSALVIEVKMNWKDGRADKLLQKYLPAVRNAFDLDITWPVVVTGNLRGYPHPPLLGLHSLLNALSWQPGEPCPVCLHP